jgi:hypothetical protein
LLTALVAGVLVPVWAILLARGAREPDAQHATI